MNDRPWRKRQSLAANNPGAVTFTTLFIRYFLRGYLPVMLILWLGVVVAFWMERDVVETRLGAQAANELVDVEANWLMQLDESVKDLQILTEHEVLKNWLRKGDEAAFSDLESAWYYFSASKRIYDQVSFIDTWGMERVRINHDKERTTMVKKETLQSKSHRDYFRESLKLEQGEAYLSLLDLNITNGGIKISHQPTLRLAAPIYSNGNKRGVVVLSLLAKYLLPGQGGRLDQDADGVQILNDKGYYLHSTDIDQSLGTMFSGEEKAQHLPDLYPSTWSGIEQSTTGVVYEKGSGFAFHKVTFPGEILWGLRFAIDRAWVLLRVIPRDEVAQALEGVHHAVLIFALILSLLLLFFLILYARVSQAKTWHQNTANDLGARLQAVMDTAPDAILLFDGNGRVNSYNMATLRMFAGDAKSFSKMRLQDLIPDGEMKLDKLLQKQLSTADGAMLNLRREFNARRFNDEWFPLELSLTETRVNGCRQFLAIARDISDIKATEEKIHRKVLFDDLTNLPNRISLRTKLESLITFSQHRKTYGALLFMDLDNFKNINDSMGHLTGDILLCRVAERLTNSLRSEDVVSRLGGDEFVVVLPMLDDDPNLASVTARDVAEKLRQALNQPVLLDGHEYVITPSIGVVLLPSEGMNADDLLRQADMAMYRAKASGRNTIRFFHPSMQAEVNDRLRVGKELRQAIERGELELYLQPQIDVEFECIVGAEALIRWNHPVRGLLAPSAFISHAEELGLIGEIGEWTLREGFSILQRLLKERPCRGLEGLAINVSPRHFRSPLFLNRLKVLMQEFNMPAHRIELEITENLLLEDVEEAVVKMNAVKALGVRFAIDDFGTGFSSLAYLKRLPVGRLKIDRSFIIDVNTDTHNAAIVETILAMAKIQQLAVTAEGVELVEEKAWLMERGCSHIQGYLYSRPLTVDDFIRFCIDFSDKTPLPIEAG
ncbi:MAG: bifunctional diguanylate cyclase/phosphodiesterase [Candidatus Thiodiazotropha sp. (ex Gloverina cf. vestifex)]|nr:bifunctional diguanylate cyclase/phosphodiesterase [Candidatus Thiodiazotropha sp. (ex Gloverina cf. vestifex)]